MRSARPVRWFTEQEQEAVDDLWRIYDAHFDEIFAMMRESARTHAAFEAVTSAISDEQFARMCSESRGRAARAMHGDPSEHEAALRAYAIEFAEKGVSFAAWYELTRIISQTLGPLLLRAYGASPDRLDAVLRVMRRYIEQRMIVQGTAYIEGKETALKQSERDLATTLESIGDAVIATDVVGTVVRMNRNAEMLTGWSLEDARGRPLGEVVEVVDDDTRERLECPVERVLREGQTVTMPSRVSLISRHGSERPVADSAAPIRDGDGSVRGVVLVFRDQTDERAAERALRESEARKAAILDAALDAIVTMDHGGVILEFNPAAERMFGRPRADAIGGSVADLLVPPLLREAHRRGLASYLATGAGAAIGRRRELSALRADGSEFPVELAVIPIAGGGHPVFTAYIRDLTEAKRARAHAEAAGRELEASREQLRALAGRLRDVREEEGRRIAREVHDVLGQALTGIKIDLTWMARRLDAGNDEQAAREQLRERCAAMSELVEVTLQSVRRIATELRPPILDDLGLEAALEWQAAEFARRTGISAVVEVPEEELPLKRECATALFRVLQEALTNVARHAGASRVEVRLERIAESVLLEIRDDGRGTSEAGVAKPGALGIVGMRERATLLGGTLTVGSAPEGGTLVSARVPLSTESADR